MDEKTYKELLKPVYASVDNFAPTNRTLINFVNEKARGEGLKRSLYKVKFIDKSELSAKQLTDMTLLNFIKHVREQNFSENDAAALEKEATEVLNGAKVQIEKVYGEVRRYILTSELRTDCIKMNFKKIPTLTDSQNETISKEIFSLALEEINKSDKHSIDDIESEFKKINHIAVTLFEIIEKEKAKEVQKKPKKEKKSFSLLDRFF
ncbi:MAG: hypothetical protein IK062_05040 [Selenomonadaceae bacterium]|nr:hypothetical protein [Selenomonadaceae bacterium]